MKERLLSAFYPIYGQKQRKEGCLSYQIKKIRTMTIMQLVKQELPDVIDNKFIKKNKEQLNIDFISKMEVKMRLLRIIKRLSQLYKLEEMLKNRSKYQGPMIPAIEEQKITFENSYQILGLIQIFLNTISNNLHIQKEKYFLKFIQNLLPQQRKKIKVFKQLEMKKKYGGRHTDSIAQKVICYFVNWSDRFFTITSEGIYYTDNYTSFQIKEVIPFCSNFRLEYRESHTGNPYGIVINASHRSLSIDAQNIFNLVFFIYFLKKAMSQSDLSVHRFDSFAAVRKNCSSKYYIDSKYYFEDVFDALISAKRQVLITGWMISPYFCLRRPDPMQRSRFDKLLGRIAERGVKISILVYNQPKIALPINSEFTQSYLNSIHKNIRVLRHPSYLLIPFLWSHHQKMIIVDQEIGFLGGLDIGYGRWDDQNHILKDQNQQIWRGVDYVNYRIKDILFPTKYRQCTINRLTTPRMPWHDIGIRINGKSVIDLSKHFVQYWNYTNFQLSINDRELLLYAGIHEDQPTLMTKKGCKYTIQKPMQERHFTKISVEQQGLKEKSNNPENSQISFYTNHLKELNPINKIDKLWQKINPKKIFKKNKNNNNVEQLIVTEIDKKNQLVGKQNHQVLRSASMWGLGLQQNNQEKSIMNAYINLIDNAKQFIYIQNQFFISVENPIAKTIQKRILKAYKQGLEFRVVIIIPALPGFDGEPHHQGSGMVRITMHHMFETICRGINSILEGLKHIPNIEDYIKFFNLRTHSIIQGCPVTQIIYVHSKIMIIDDKIALIGSANINDRSLLGSRDTQIGILIEDQQNIRIKLSLNKERQVNKFAHNLRRELYEEHFHLTSQQAEDYLNTQVWKDILKHADKNQDIYEQVFGCYPNNEIRCFEDIQKMKKKANIEKYESLKGLIKGNAVPFQENFLQQEDLTLQPQQASYYLPEISFH